MPSCQPAIYLHIGPPKTGTTYLQDVLWRNRPRLAALGIAVPGRSLVDHFHAALDLRGMQFGGYDDPRVDGAWLRLARAATTAGARKAIVSHEVFGGADEAQIARVARDLGPHELHLVYGARDLARQLPALWQESLKNRKTRPFDTFLANAIRSRGEPPPRHGIWRSQDAVQTLRRWSAAIPPGRIHVVTLPQPGAAPDTLWRRFAAAIAIPAAGVDLDVARANTSLPPEQAELLRRLNKALPGDLGWPDYERLVKRTFNAAANAVGRQGSAPAGAQGVARVRVPERHRDLLLEWAVQTRTELAGADYDIVGDLTDLVPSAAAFGPGAEPQPDMVADAAIELLAAALTSQPGRRTGDTRDRARTLMGQFSRGRGRA